jgi:CubicO group peptidase (beta-lactamase class C family)
MNLSVIERASLTLAMSVALTMPTQVVRAELGPAQSVDLGKQLDAYYIGAAAKNEFSGVVLVAKGDTILARKAYGMANREWDVPNTPDTRFELGEMSSGLLTTAALSLVEKGKLRLDAPVCDYIDRCPANWREIRVEHLINMSSGLTDYIGMLRAKGVQGKPHTVRQLIELIRPGALSHPPGESVDESPTNFLVLAAVIDKASGSSYERYMSEAIFTPAGMTNSGINNSLSVLKRRASGYTAPQVRGYVVDAGNRYGSNLYSTADEMLAFNRALHAGKLISKQNVANMLTRSNAVVNQYPPLENMSIATTWRTGVINGHEYIADFDLTGWSGDWSSFSTGFGGGLIYFPKDDITIVNLNNSSASPLQTMIIVSRALWDE